MKTMKLMSFAVAVLLAFLLSSTVQAQKDVGAFVTFQGIEISTGHENPSEAYGWMCYAKTTGALPGNFTLSMDFLGIKEPGTSSDVTGGAWTLPVYTTSKIYSEIPIRIDPYQGVLFGSVDGGSVTWDKTGATATVELKMSIKGGTQTMANTAGTVILYGTVIYDEKTGLGTFDGTMYFDFQ